MICKEIISACRGTQNVAARKSAVSNCTGVNAQTHAHKNPHVHEKSTTACPLECPINPLICTRPGIANALRHLSFAVIATVRTVKTRQNLRRSGRRPSKVSKKEIPAPSSPKLVPRMEDICVVVTARSQAAKRSQPTSFLTLKHLDFILLFHKHVSMLIIFFLLFTDTANVFKRVFYVEAVVNAPFVKTAVQLLMLSQLRVVPRPRWL